MGTWYYNVDTWRQNYTWQIHKGVQTGIARPNGSSKKGKKTDLEFSYYYFIFLRCL